LPSDLTASVAPAGSACKAAQTAIGCQPARRQQRASAEVGIALLDGDGQSGPRSVRGGSPAHSDGRKSTGKA